MDIFLTMAQSAVETASADDSVSGTTIVTIVTAVVTLLTGVGGGVKLFWNSMMKRVDDMRADFMEQLKGKDKQIEELSKALSKKSDEQAATVERIQNQTIAKIEAFAEKNAELMERFVEGQAKLSGILSAIEIRLQK